MVVVAVVVVVVFVEAAVVLVAVWRRSSSSSSSSSNSLFLSTQPVMLLRRHGVSFNFLTYLVLRSLLYSLLSQSRRLSPPPLTDRTVWSLHV